MHGVGWSLSVQFEYNHPTVMAYTMGQRVQMIERYVYDFTVENPWRYMHNVLSKINQ